MSDNPRGRRWYPWRGTAVGWGLRTHSAFATTVLTSSSRSLPLALVAAFLACCPPGARAQDVVWRTASGTWDTTTLGNHRAVVLVESTEVSGIPFGLMGEMLVKGGNPWRGMLCGMTNRLPWSEAADPRPIWKAWDEFGMQGSRMIGSWVARSPVTTNRPDKPATVYVKDRKALVAIASWAEGDADVTLTIDSAALGIDPARAIVEAPAIARFQHARRVTLGKPVPVPPGKGWLLVVAESEGGAR